MQYAVVFGLSFTKRVSFFFHSSLLLANVLCGLCVCISMRARKMHCQNERKNVFGFGKGKTKNDEYGKKSAKRIGKNNHTSH